MIHLISGKGGVGKSTVAASMAWSLAAQGRKTLLVELGERSYYRHVFHSEIGVQPISINTHLSVARWDGENCLREYLQHLLKIETVVRLFFDNKIMKALVEAAPALKELAILGKLTSGVRRAGPALPFDELVVDAFATGHFRALWRAPIGLGSAIPFGPMGDQSRGIVDVLKNPAQTQFYVVAIPEELPVTEGLELAADIEAELHQTPRLLMNRWLECPLSATELTKFSGHPFADYLTIILERQKAMEKLVGKKLRHLPWLFSDNVAEKIRSLAGLLEAQP